MAGSGDYTAEQLAFKAGLPLRTVRFYVQEKLIDAPLGRGPGAHFTDRHLAQLQQARTLQNSGFDLASIRERKDDLELGQAVMSAWEDRRLAWARSLAEAKGPISPRAPDADELDPDRCLRIPMAEGIELLVDETRRLPSPKQLVELAFQIRRLFGEP